MAVPHSRPPAGAEDQDDDGVILALRTGGATLLGALGGGLVAVAFDGGAVVATGLMLTSAGLGCWASLVLSGLRRRRRPSRLSTVGLDHDDAHRLQSAAGQARRLRLLADATPSGPVAEHLAELAATADQYVEALQAALRARGRTGGSTLGSPAPVLGGDGGALTEEADDIVRQLRELTAAAEDLRRTQRRVLEPSRLDELTTRTRRLIDALETGAEPGVAGPSEPMEGPDEAEPERP